MHKTIIIFLTASLLAFFCPVKITAQLSKEFIASLPKENRPSGEDKPELSVEEKIGVINNFRSSVTIPKVFIPVYDSITTSLCHDFDAEKNPYKKMTIGIRLTSYYNLVGDYQKSLSYTDAMLVLADKYDTTKTIKVGHQRLKGSLLAKLRRHEEAVNFINANLDIARAKKDTFGIGLLFYSLAVTYSTINLPETTIQFIDSSFYYYDLVVNKPPELAKAYSESVGVKFAQTFNLFELGNDTTWLKKLRDIMSFGQPKNIKRPFFVVYPIVEAYSRKEYDTCIARSDSFLNKSNLLKISINDYIALVVTKYKALSLYEMGRQKEGIQLLEKPIQEIMENPGKDEAVIRLRLPFLYKTTQVLQDFYKANGNWDKAYRYIAIHQSVRDTLDYITNQGRIFEANQKYNFAKKEIKVQELEKDNAIKIKERNYAFFVTVIALLSFIIIASLLYNNNRNIKYKKKIAEQEARNKIDRLNIATQLQIAELEEKNSVTRQEEQKRLGRELHDDLAGDIVFLKSKIELEILNNKEKETATGLKEISAYTSGIYEKVRNKSHAWHNIAIDESDSSFKKRIQSLIDNGLPGDKYKKNILIDDDALRLLAIPVKIELLYIIQEALVNILKHADATAVDLFLYEDIQGVVLQINDNGKGFPEKTFKKGIGLQSIESRVNQLTGKFAISSGKTGTELGIVLPPEILKTVS